LFCEYFFLNDREISWQYGKLIRTSISEKQWTPKKNEFFSPSGVPPSTTNLQLHELLCFYFFLHRWCHLLKAVLSPACGKILYCLGTGNTTALQKLVRNIKSWHFHNKVWFCHVTCPRVATCGIFCHALIKSHFQKLPNAMQARLPTTTHKRTRDRLSFILQRQLSEQGNSIKLATKPMQGVKHFWCQFRRHLTTRTCQYYNY